ncbi:MAG TPA: AzlD domain-containing protein [Coriobacteriia bacterium]|jgi:branched-subunit amino acid transport protein
MRPYYVLLILLMAAVTYVSRVGLIGVARQLEIHPLLRRSLEYVPVSILAALVFPAVFAPAGKIEMPFANIYVWASVVTGGVLLTTKRQWLAIVAGVASLVVLRRVTGA